MASARDIVISLNITTEEYLLWYQGSVKTVFTYARDGRSISFPANILQPFVTRNGIQGRFAITFDENNKLVSIQKVS
ncbi:MAG: DUF2835 domain-containing protein [Pseudomonadales bacterium]|nr:DUF2835 domain-containing protein [Pseudomonadales bacterium]